MTTEWLPLNFNFSLASLLARIIAQLITGAGLLSLVEFELASFVDIPVIQCIQDISNKYLHLDFSIYTQYLQFYGTYHYTMHLFLILQDDKCECVI